MIKVDATLLDQWADRHESWFALPELVRRLVLATADVRSIDMPSGDAVLYPGWDGIIDTATGTPWVPDGWSAWEIGTNRGYEAKASGDYRKRLKDTQGINASQATYVFVTPRKWPAKRKWVAARKAEGVWRDVRVYDASDLETWLDQARQIALWFAAEVLRLPQALLERPSPKLGWDPAALRPEAGPLSWLTWKARLTGLIGRDAEKAELLRWARETGGEVRFRFLVGEGGSGKTRLAHEVAEELAKDPAWTAGLVPADTPLPLDSGIRGCLLLIDYPEEKREAVRDRLAEIVAERHDPARPVRVLFLTRHGEEYWQPLVQDARAYVRLDPPCILPEGVDPGDAWTIFQAAVGRVPREPGAPPPRPVEEDAFRRWIGRMPVNQRPLLIAAAAVEAVHEPERPILSLTGPQVIVALADREAERLRPLARRHGFDENALVRLTALAAVRGTLDAATIRRLAEPALDLSLGPTSGLAERLRRTGCLKQDGIPAPVPDIVAAAFVVQALTGQDMAPEWLWAAMDGDVGTAIDRLGRLTYDAEFVLGLGNKHFSDCLARVVEASPDRAARLEPYLSDYVIPLGLLGLSAAVYRTRLASATEDNDRARYASNLSVRLGEMGDGAGALAVIREAVEIRRRLAAANPARYEADLAGSLNNLSADLSAAGDGAGALAAIREAVEIDRRLAAANPARYEANLAMDLNNLSNRLSDAGDRARALVAIREAVEVFRRLAVANPARYEADLAGSLNNLSNRLSDAGDRARALVVIREAVEVFRRLAVANPARHEADLLVSLNNLSNRLSDAGDGAGALAASREAVEIRRRLAASNPARYTTDLALSLFVMGRRLDEAGRPCDALPLAEEAVRLNGPAAQAVPGGPAARLHALMLGELERLSAKCTEDAAGPA